MSVKKIELGDITFGADELFLITGPCVIEDEAIMLRTAEKIKEVTTKLNIPTVYKSSFMKDNRSSVDYYVGPGTEEGLRILEKVKKEFGFSLITDIHFPGHVDQVADVVDILQIPAYLAMQTSLLTAAGNTGKIVNLKHPQFLAPENMGKPAAKVASTGNDKILLTERGYVFGYNDLIVDPRSFYEMRQTGYPVIFDITHSIRKYGIPSADPNGGAKQYLDTLARAGVASGVDGLFVETHPCPNEALCDAASQLDMNNLEEFLKPLIEIHNTEVKYRK